MTDREVQATKQFLQEFGYLGCFQIAQRRADRDIMAGPRRGLRAPTPPCKCLPACCRPWGELQPVMPPGRRKAGNESHSLRGRAGDAGRRDEAHDLDVEHLLGDLQDDRRTTVMRSIVG
jgi:hypothetical protein